ncbi:MAG: NAD-dependent epimerase/dehydratase family protein [Flavobacteriaceae bacterium TMED42]|nr:MAG: NAD-dependent epimerase/dehydratase family protein [Flavobacteriaceae bacterium TMED42]
MKQTIVLAGASGFIGRWIIEEFQDEYQIIALSRKKVKTNPNEKIIWRTVDLYSMSSTEKAMEGADIAIYLVHSMQPSTRLNQGKFEDTDLLLADNFSRAAQKNKLKQIIYLGGILPKDKHKISNHLLSRFEVEKTLGSRATPLTAIRAGIIIGPGGSSFRIVSQLVKNLPVMGCPQWTKSENQPIDVFDILSLIKQCAGNPVTYDKNIEVGGNEVMTYMNLLQKTSKIMHKRRLIFSMPFFTVGLSKWWVSIFGDSNINFVSPLVESLKHRMIPSKKHDDLYHIDFTPVDNSIKRALTHKPPALPTFHQSHAEKNTVRSVQRIYNPGKYNAQWVAKHYPIWLSKRFAGLINPRFDGSILRFYLLGIMLLELQLIEDRSTPNRQLFYITGGVLTKRTDLGWLEFRSILDNEYVITAIHEYVPKLPWAVYKLTQAKLHLYVMKKFEKELQRLK